MILVRLLGLWAGSIAAFLGTSVAYAETYYGQHNFSQNTGTHTLTTDTGDKYTLTGSIGLVSLGTSNVVVIGERNGPARIEVKSIEFDPRPQKIAGVRRIAALIFEYENAPVSGDLDIIRQDLQTEIMSAPRSVNAYLQEISGGKLSVTLDVFGIYKIPDDGSDCPSVPSELIRQIFDPSAPTAYDNFEHFMFIFKAPRCKHDDFAIVQGKQSNFYYYDFYEIANEAWLIIHELTHNLGLLHATSVDCRGKSLPLPRTLPIGVGCSFSEYGDEIDIQGTGSYQGFANHVSTWAKYVLGLLPESAVLTVTAPGVFELIPREVNDFGIRALRIPRGKLDSLIPSDAGRAIFRGEYDYWIEFAQPIGSDTQVREFWRGIFEGALIRLVPRSPASNFIGQGPAWSNSLIVTSGLNTAESPEGHAMQPALRFTDEEMGITIRTIRLTKNSTNPSLSKMLLQVCFNGLPCEDLPTPPLLHYKKSSYPMQKGKEIKSSKFTNFGSAVTSCSIAPKLPKGLVFNEKRCSFAGKPAPASKGKKYKISAKNSYGETAVPITLYVPKAHRRSRLSGLRSR